MLSNMTTGFIQRLRANDEAAWFELWETFGPVIRAQLTKWGKGRIGSQTVRDLSQETLAALSDSIDRFDPSRGARFSTWLLAIAKHVLGDEMDRADAQKRGGATEAPPSSTRAGWPPSTLERRRGIRGRRLPRQGRGRHPYGRERIRVHGLLHLSHARA
jgi:DNA-directed RNA polymerase specialized sigma24 family protein